MSRETIKLEFNKDAVYQGELYAKAGEVRDVVLAAGFANRWISRGIAHEVVVAEEQMPVESKPTPVETKSKNKAGSGKLGEPKELADQVPLPEEKKSEEIDL